MIKINLLSQRKARKVDKGQQTALVAMAIIAAACVAVFFLVHKPMSDDVASIERTNKEITQKNAQKQAQLNAPPGAVKIKARIKELEARQKSINKLDSDRSVPADFLYELSKILTQRKGPTMGDATSARPDIVRKLDDEWDPKSVWVTNFKEKGGEFTLEGGAQSDQDVTSLQHRLQASAYFEQVVPLEAKQVLSKDSIAYYQFTITGKVVY